MKYFDKPSRTSHTISQTPSVRNVPRNTRSKASDSKPADLRNGHGRCASCARRSGRK